MNRQQARELAASTLTALSTYQAVYEGVRRTFGGISPVACVLSKSLQIIPVARDVFQGLPKLSITVYVRCDDGGEDAAEDQMDSLIEAAIVAFKNAGFTVGESDSAPEGAPLRNIDGVFYRAETIPLTMEEDY